MEDRLTRTATHERLRRDEAQAFVALLALFAITVAWWALALWPVPDDPAWLQRTRYACFGITESGLPDTAGWIGLIAGPLGMLSILLVGWLDAMRRLLLRARTSRTVAAALSTIVIGCMALALAASWRVRNVRAATVIADAQSTPASLHPRIDRAAPPLRLTAQSGDVVDLATLRGRTVIVTFAYAHCTTICPLDVARALRAQDALRAAGNNVAIMVVTLDPWRDTPTRLAAIASSWHLTRDAFVLSGSVTEVENALDAWEVPRTRDERTGEVTHPSLSYIVDRIGRIAFATNGDSDTIVALVGRL